ncbi:FAD-binding domain-containing protein [Ophiobolus disseminans]|uniref:Delta(24)-sterol reductase n=1 Tax=Ophiobolus disseminans TaxID=1469910 RepID=A0A6A6ZX44_9PLEO|nr:FAD-binding domain-containing protein [Ophiobolus disseminans]
MASHEEVVADISATVKSLHARKQPFRIFHGSTNSTRPAHDDRFVDITALFNVLEVDGQRMIATVEANLPMDKLVRATLAHGMIPPIVMEFSGITVGGGYAGSAGESSSFRYGYFDQSVISAEMVLATGEVITASGSENANIFKGAAGALGTLGITTKLELRLIEAKRFVKLVYQPYSSVQDTITALRKATADPGNDYVDGIMFSQTHGVVMIGHLTNDIPASQIPQTFSGPWDLWFYLYAESKPLTHQSTDYIPIAECLFRYDRGGFWVGKVAFDYFGFVPFTRLTRWFLNDFMHTRMMYRALHRSNMSFGTMIHDLTLPYDTAEDFIDYATRELGVWPLWLCPLRAVETPTFHPTSKGGVSQPMLNIGLRGAGSKDVATFIRQNRNLEARLRELSGRKVLYSHTYYEELRKRYSATTLPTVYDKVKVDVTRLMSTQQLPWYRRLGESWPSVEFLGIWCAIQSKDYWVHRDLGWMS